MHYSTAHCSHSVRRDSAISAQGAKHACAPHKPMLCISLHHRPDCFQDPRTPRETPEGAAT